MSFVRIYIGNNGYSVIHLHVSKDVGDKDAEVGSSDNFMFTNLLGRQCHIYVIWHIYT